MKHSYIFFTWITTVIGGPILFLLYTLLIQDVGFVLKTWDLLLLTFFLGIFLSVPALLVYILVFNFMNRKIVNVNVLRISLLFLSLFLLIASFRLFIGSSSPYIEASYTIANVLATAIFWRKVTT